MSKFVFSVAYLDVCLLQLRTKAIGAMCSLHGTYQLGHFARGFIDKQEFMKDLGVHSHSLL